MPSNKNTKNLIGNWEEIVSKIADPEQTNAETTEENKSTEVPAKHAPVEPKPATPELKMHDLAVVFPDMGTAELEALTEDIRINGLLEKILTYKGKIVDGRHRYKALVELKEDDKPQHYEEFVKDETKPGSEKDQLYERVMSHNLRRRHLNESQRAMIASKVANIPWGHKLTDTKGGIKQELAAKIFNVSKSLIGMAQTVYEYEDKKFSEAVFNGEMAVSAAKNEIRKLTQKPVKPPVARMSAGYIKRQGITLTRLPALGLLNAIEDGAIDCCITDPPYNSGITGWDCNFDPIPLLKELGRVLKVGGSALIFCNDSLLPYYLSNSVVGLPPTGSEIESADANLKKYADKTVNIPAIKKLIVAEKKAKKAYEDAKKHSYDVNAKELIENAKAVWNTAKDNLKKDRKIYADVKAYEDAEVIVYKLAEKENNENNKPLILHQILHWYKRNNEDKQKSNKNRFQPTIEYILWFTKGENHTFNRMVTYGFKDLFDGGERVTDVFSTTILGSSYANTEGNRHSKNESLKPFRLIELLVKTCSNPKDIILDCYHGKGITALVSFLSNRSCITSELDPRKVYGVQQWRLTDLFQFTAQDTNLIDRNVPVTFEQLKKVKEIAKIMQLHEYKGVDIVKQIDGVTTTITAQEQLEQWRDYYIYNKYIWSVIKAHPEFNKAWKNVEETQKKLTKQRVEIWNAEDLWDDNYYFEPEGLKRDIFPMDSYWNFSELVSMQQELDPYNRPLNDPLTIAYKRELKPLEESEFDVEFKEKYPDRLTYKQLNDVRKYMDWNHEVIIDGEEVIFNVLPVEQYGVSQNGFERVGGTWSLEEWGNGRDNNKEERDARLVELGLSPDLNEMSIRALTIVYHSDKYKADHLKFHGYKHPLFGKKTKPPEPIEEPVIPVVELDTPQETPEEA